MVLRIVRPPERGCGVSQNQKITWLVGLLVVLFFLFMPPHDHSGWLTAIDMAIHINYTTLVYRVVATLVVTAIASLLIELAEGGD